MNGDGLAVRVREILRDVQTIVHQGEFWSDREIRLALNQSQAQFINIALRLKLDYLLAGLHSTTGYVTPVTDATDPNYLGGWIALPNDYLHYVSGMVGYEDNLFLARLYLGATAEVYRNTQQAGIFIINNLYRGILRNDVETGVVLNYFRQPYYIGLTSMGDNPAVTPVTGRTDFLLQDFDDYVYNDIIVGHAAVILGMKETQTQREFKIKKQIFSHYSIFPKRLISLLNDVERVRELIEQFMGKQGG